MANPNIPNLCGANPNLNGALSKIAELKDKLVSNIDVDASALKSELEGGLDELKSAFDKLEVELPEAPAVNLQAEVTSLINDIDKTSIAGITAFNAKLATLKLDFGNTLQEKGIDFDELIASAETKLAGGGNVCDLVSNLEIPAGNSGSGITTETKEERGSGTSITLTETPKSIVSVQGQKTGTNFFSNITYKQLGRALSTSEQDADGNVVSYAVIKVTYIVDLIKEKPIAAKQADKDGEKEEPSIVSKNISSTEKNVEAKVKALSKQINDKTAAGVSTDDVQKQFDTLIATVESEEFKKEMETDFAAAKEEYDKIAQDPIKDETITVPQKNVSSWRSPPKGRLVGGNQVYFDDVRGRWTVFFPDALERTQYASEEDAVAAASEFPAATAEEPKVRTVKATTTKNRNTVTQTQTTITTTGGGSTTITRPKTEKTVISENGFMSRKNTITEKFILASAVEELSKIRKAFGGKRYKHLDSLSNGIKLKKTPFEIKSVRGAIYTPNKALFTYYNYSSRKDKNNITPSILGDTNEVYLEEDIFGDSEPSIEDVQVLKITYRILENIDPNFFR